jgi:hypothetical protein
MEPIRSGETRRSWRGAEMWIVRLKLDYVVGEADHLMGFGASTACMLAGDIGPIIISYSLCPIMGSIS